MTGAGAMGCLLGIQKYRAPDAARRASGALLTRGPRFVLHPGPGSAVHR